MKKPTCEGRRRAWFFRSLWPITSGHGSPPAWKFHDDGGDRDGGGSASNNEVIERTKVCQMFCLRTAWGKAENGAVRVRLRFTVLAIAMLGVCLAGMAQYHDQDTRGVPKTSATAPPAELRIDINRASMDELLKVPGMTRSWAGRIVRFRPYRSKLELLDRGVVTSQVYVRIMDYVIAHQKAQ
jgi:DNA uptake protein ComE-like DNA-binding protein